jgi:hypothetical protein
MDSRTIDLEKLTRIFTYLTTDEGGPALDALASGLEAFRRALHTDVNEGEFKYLASALINQRSNQPSSPSVPLTRTPDAAFNLRHGFVIKAKI